MMDVDALISAVYSREILWNSRHKKYHDRDLVRRNWEQVGEELGEIGKYHFKTLTLKNLPEGYSFSSMVDGLLKGLPFHFWLSQSIEILDLRR